MFKRDAATLLPKLKIACPTKAFGGTSGNCGIPTNQWQCDVIDAGSGYDLAAEFVAVSPSSTGTATIVYSELDTKTVYINIYLKPARQLTYNLNFPLIVR